MEYVDVIFVHRYDETTPLEETCRAFSWLIDQGLAFYWARLNGQLIRSLMPSRFAKILIYMLPSQSNLFTICSSEKDLRKSTGTSLRSTDMAQLCGLFLLLASFPEDTMMETFLMIVDITKTLPLKIWLWADILPLQRRKRLSRFFKKLQILPKSLAILKANWHLRGLWPTKMSAL